MILESNGTQKALSFSKKNRRERRTAHFRNQRLFYHRYAFFLTFFAREFCRICTVNKYIENNSVEENKYQGVHTDFEKKFQDISRTFPGQNTKIPGHLTIILDIKIT